MYLRKLREAACEPGENEAAPPIPAWLDVNKFNRGRQFFLDNMFNCIMAMLMSLILGLSIPRFLEPLVFTGKSDEARKSLRRYLSTLKHVIIWHHGDVWDCPDGDAYRSIITVRRMHQKVTQDLTKHARSKVKPAETKSSNGTDASNGIDACNGTDTFEGTDASRGSEVGVFLSQYDMALVQSGFMGMITMYPESFGIERNISGLDDYIYFWRGIGHLLGISDKNNICNDGYDKAYLICKEIQTDIVIPSLEHPPKDFPKMMNAVIDGIQLITKYRICTFEVILLWIADVYVLERKIGFYDYIRYYFLRCMFLFIKYCGPFRRMLNRMILRGLGITK